MGAVGDVGEVIVTVDADLVAGDGAVVRIGPGKCNLAVTRPDRGNLRGGRRRNWPGGHGGCRAVTGIVHRAHRKGVLGAVGQAGHGVSGGGRIGVGDGDVRPRSVGAVVAAPHFRADLVLGDRSVARIVPRKHHLAVARRGRGNRRGVRHRNRCGPHAGGFAVTGSVHCAQLKPVRAAVSQAGHGVGGGGRTAAADVAPVAEIGAAHPLPVLIPGDAAVVRIVPGQHSLPVSRHGREVRRGGRHRHRHGVHAARSAGDHGVVPGRIHRLHREGVVGAIGQAGNEQGRLIPRAGREKRFQERVHGVDGRVVGADLITGDPGVAPVPRQHDLALARRRHQTGRRGPERRGGFGGRRAGTGQIHRPQLERVFGAVGQAGTGAVAQDGHGVGGGGRTAALDIDEGRAAVGAVLVSADHVVVRVVPGQCDLTVLPPLGHEARRGGRKRRRGHGRRRAHTGSVHRAQLERVLGAVGQAGHGVGEGVVRIVFADVGVVDIGERLAAVGADLVPGDCVVVRIVPGQRNLGGARRGRERRRSGRHRHRRGGYGGCEAFTRIVFCAHGKRVLGAVGQAHDRVCGGLLVAVRNPAVVVAAVGADLIVIVADGCIVARLAPAQRHLAVTRRGREVLRGVRDRNRHGVHGRRRALTGTVPRAHLKRVGRAVDQAGRGVCGGVRGGRRKGVGAGDVRPGGVGAVVAVLHLPADLVLGDRDIARIVPFQHDPAVTRRGRGNRRVGWQRRRHRCGFHAGFHAGLGAAGCGRPHREGIFGAVGQRMIGIEANGIVNLRRRCAKGEER